MYDELLALSMESVLAWRLLGPTIFRVQKWNQRTEEGQPWVDERMAYLRDYGRGACASLEVTPKTSRAEEEFTATTSFGEGLLRATRKSSRS